MLQGPDVHLGLRDTDIVVAGTPVAPKLISSVLKGPSTGGLLCLWF